MADERGVAAAVERLRSDLRARISELRIELEGLTERADRAYQEHDVYLMEQSAAVCDALAQAQAGRDRATDAWDKTSDELLEAKSALAEAQQEIAKLRTRVDELDAANAILEQSLEGAGL